MAPVTLLSSLLLFAILVNPTLSIPLPSSETSPMLVSSPSQEQGQSSMPEVPTSFAALEDTADPARLQRYNDMGLQPTPVQTSQHYSNVHPDARAFPAMSLQPLATANAAAGGVGTGLEQQNAEAVGVAGNDGTSVRSAGSAVGGSAEGTQMQTGTGAMGEVVGGAVSGTATGPASEAVGSAVGGAIGSDGAVRSAVGGASGSGTESSSRTESNSWASGGAGGSGMSASATESNGGVNVGAGVTGRSATGGGTNEGVVLGDAVKDAGIIQNSATGAQAAGPALVEGSSMAGSVEGATGRWSSGQIAGTETGQMAGIVRGGVETATPGQAQWIGATSEGAVGVVAGGMGTGGVVSV